MEVRDHCLAAPLTQDTELLGLVLVYTTCSATARAAEQKKLRPLSSALAFSCNWALGPGGLAGAPFSVTTAPAWASHSTFTVVHSETSGWLRVRLGAGKPGGGVHSEPRPWH